MDSASRPATIVTGSLRFVISPFQMPLAFDSLYFITTCNFGKSVVKLLWIK